VRNVLVTGPPLAPGRDQDSPLAAELARAGYRTARLAPDDDVDDFCHAFGGTPPDLVIADLSSARDPLLPLQHLRRRLSQAWGDDLPPPPCIALLTPAHLERRKEWITQIDDFLLPPYDLAEARARVDLMLFRRRSMEATAMLTFAGMQLDLSTGNAYDEDGTPLPLRPREFDLLRFLVTHRGKLFPRERLLDFVWGIDFGGGDRTVDIHIRRLRAKLPERVASLLETRRGVGYGFRVS